jgi:hypothetical protein
MAPLLLNVTVINVNIVLHHWRSSFMRLLYRSFPVAKQS